MYRFITVVLFLASVIGCYAVKAWPFPVDVRQSDYRFLCPRLCEADTGARK